MMLELQSYQKYEILLLVDLVYPSIIHQFIKIINLVSAPHPNELFQATNNYNFNCQNEAWKVGAKANLNRLT